MVGNEERCVNLCFPKPEMSLTCDELSLNPHSVTSCLCDLGHTISLYLLHVSNEASKSAYVIALL